MIIYSKKQFNAFSNFARERLIKDHNFTIKPLKLSNELAISMGFNSHNHLLSSLPFELPSGTENTNKCDAILSERLKSSFGFKDDIVQFLADVKFDYIRFNPSWESIDPAMLDRENPRFKSMDSIGEIKPVDENKSAIAFVFNDDGIALEKAIDSVIPGAVHPTQWQEQNVIDTLVKLRDANPDNLYIRVRLFNYIAGHLAMQMSWDQYIFNGLKVKNPYGDENIADYARKNAEQLFRGDMGTIDALLDFVGVRDKYWAPYQPVKDCTSSNTFYIEAIFLASRVAMNAGKLKIAKELLLRYWRVVKGKKDPFDGVDYLTTLHFLAHGTRVSKFISDDTKGTFPCMLRAIEHFRLGDEESAISEMVMAAFCNRGVIELFVGRLYEFSTITTVDIGLDAPATALEVDHLLQSFWSKNPECRDFFVQALSIPEVKALIIEHHLSIEKKPKTSFLSDAFPHRF
ncbi:MAG TPA: hypothetical protein DCS78_03635 [Pseudoalteromonas shioyasakiensis]|nr:hypothetical protein [Pseudoalteromonas shioyasakiensis]